MKPWRIIYWPDASPLDYIVTRPLVNDMRAEGKVPDTLVIYCTNRYFVAVGRHINIDDDIDMESCRRIGVEVFRKIGGGGSGIWGPNSFQFAFAFGVDLFPDMEEALRVMCSEVLLGAVRRIGVAQAYYKHIGDLRVGDRKLGALAALPHGKDCVNMGGFLNIDDLDLSIASSVFKTPAEKFSDKVAKDIQDYATSLRREMGTDISKVDYLNAIVDEFETAIGTRPELGKLTQQEMALYDRYRERFASEEWTHYKSSLKRFVSIPEGYGLGLNRRKARKLVTVYSLVDREGKIADVMVSGDYFISPIDGDDRIVRDLVGIDAADVEAIERKMREASEAMGFEAMMMDIEDFVIPVTEACRQALDQID